MALLFSPLAATDLGGIADHIARDNPRRALTFIQGIREQCKKLDKAPLGYRARPELGAGIRSCAYGNYVILFRPDASDVLIVRVLHGAMDLPRHVETDLAAGRPADEPTLKAKPGTPVGKQK
jgi:toxin ParE1/3/4